MQENLLENAMASGYEPTYGTIYDYNNVPEAEDFDISEDNDEDYDDYSSEEGSLYEENEEDDLDQSDLVWLPGIEEIAES